MTFSVNCKQRMHAIVVRILCRLETVNNFFVLYPVNDGKKRKNSERWWNGCWFPRFADRSRNTSTASKLQPHKSEICTIKRADTAAIVIAPSAPWTVHLHGTRTHPVNNIRDRMPLDVPLGEQTFLLKSLGAASTHAQTSVPFASEVRCDANSYTFSHTLTFCLHAYKRLLVLVRCCSTDVFAHSLLWSNIRGRCSPIAFHLRIMYSTRCLGNAHELPALAAISYWCNPSTCCGVQEAFSFAVADTTKQLRVVELSRSRLQTMRVCTKLFAR